MVRGESSAYAAGWLNCYYGDEELEGYVYLLRHIPTERVYIGSSTGSRTGRYASHIRMLEGGTHYNKDFQGLWSGDVSEWSYQILEDRIPKTHLVDREREYCQRFSWLLINKDLPKEDKTSLYKEIYEEVCSGLTYREVRDKLGVSLGTVVNAVRSFKP